MFRMHLLCERHARGLREQSKWGAQAPWPRGASLHCAYPSALTWISGNVNPSGRDSLSLCLDCELPRADVQYCMSLHYVSVLCVTVTVSPLWSVQRHVSPCGTTLTIARIPELFSAFHGGGRGGSERVKWLAVTSGHRVVASSAPSSPRRDAGPAAHQCWLLRHTARDQSLNPHSAAP